MPGQAIVHLIPGLYLGGAEKVLTYICDHQKKSGFKVYVVAFERSGFEHFYPTLNVIHCNVQYQDSLFTKVNIHTQNYETIIDETGPSVIHSHSQWTDLISHHRLRADIRYISHFHLCYDFYLPSLRSAIASFRFSPLIDKWRLVKKYANQNCYLMASSEFIRDFYRKCLPKSVARKIFTLNNPVSIGAFTQAPSPQFDLLTIGRLEEVKNHLLALQVIRRAAERGFHWTLAIVGEGTMRVTLQEHCRRLQIDDRVTFVGATTALEKFFSISSIYLHTAHSETFGLSIFEAMAAGLPIVTKKFNGLNANVFMDNVNCKVIDSDNADEYIDAITRIKSDINFRARLIDAGYHTAAGFSLHEYLIALDKFYLITNG
jgi:glycosyltransferase involved in cell wall biosynthesis